MTMDTPTVPTHATAVPPTVPAIAATNFALPNTEPHPVKVQVRDVSSGRSYTTYQPWGHVEKGIGYTFTDAESGNRVTLQEYELKTLEEQKVVAGDSVEAKEFAAAKARGGVK